MTQYDEDILVEELIEDVIEDQDNLAKIVVYNDDVNTFDWVIECFVKVCKHSAQQAEQLSYIVHFKGKAIVKTGEKKLLKPMKDSLTQKGLSAVLEQ